MAIHIQMLNIDHFRGINCLTLENLNHVNIIAGDNNCGKTSVLEAILLLRNPKDFNNVLRVSRIRDTATPFNMVSLYESVLNLFPQNVPSSEISINGICMGESVLFRFLGEQKTIMLAAEDILQNSLATAAMRRERLKQYPDGLEIISFSGNLITCINGEHNIKSIAMLLRGLRKQAY